MLRVFVCAFLLLSTGGFGDNLLDPLKQAIHEEAVPNPLNLGSNWWHYYNVDAKTLEKRKEEAQKLFAEIIKQLPEVERAKAETFSEKFLSGLQTLINLKGQSKPLSSYIGNFPEKYAFTEWLALGAKLLENQRELEDKELRVNLMQLSIRSASRQLDTLFASYLTEKTGETASRFFKGLEIMTAKVNLEIDQIKLSFLEAEVEIQKGKIQQIQKEVAHSRTRINFRTTRTREINKNILEMEERLKKSQGELIDVYDLNISSSLGGDSNVKREIAEQNVMEHNVDRIHDRIILINFKLQKLILQWGKREIKVDRSIAKAINEYKGQVDQIARETQQWKNETELMLEHSLKHPTVLMGGEPDSQEIALFQELLASTERIIVKIQQIQNEIFFFKFLSEQITAMKQKLPAAFGGKFVIVWDAAEAFFESHAKWFKQSLFKLGNIPITPLGIFKVILIILVAFALAKFFRSNIRKFGKKHQLLTTSSLYILSGLTYYFILALGFVIAGISIGFDLTAFAFIAGAITVWIGFSLQSIFHNFISGIIILLTKTLNVNDVIVLDSGELGQVIEINLRTTILSTPDGVDIVIPNSELVSKKFVNRTLIKYSRRVNIPFRIALGADKNFIKKILVNAVKEVPITLPNPEPELWVISYGDNFINCELAIWVNEFLTTYPNMSTNALYFNIIDDTLRANNIEIPIVHSWPTLEK